MKHLLKSYLIIIVLISSTCCFSCKKDPPIVTTSSVTDISQTTAISGGNVLDNGGQEVTVRGVCYGTSQNPDIKSLKTSDGTGNGPFTSSITGLTANTEYHIRAYATNSVGTSYGDDVSFFTKPNDISNTIQDIDGNTYNVVQIGTQFWMKENLKTTRFNNGVSIPLVTDGNAWGNLTSSGYCWYNNDPSTYKAVYGALYNWYTANTGTLCPAGWHVPSDAEWTVITDYLGGVSVAGGKMKETGTSHWSSPNTNASNSSGFTALPSGYRSFDTFTAIGATGAWWSSNEFDAASARTRGVTYNNSNVDVYTNGKAHGFSIRCIKD